MHDYPGTVDTALLSRAQGVSGVVLRMYIGILGRWVCVPMEESGERHLYLATSARFPALRGGSAAVQLGAGAGVALGTTGEIGSGVYSVGWDCESASGAVRKLLAGLRDKGMVEEVWRHTEGEFNSITELDGRL